LSDEEHSKKTRDVVRDEREFLKRELAQIRGFTVFPPDANFIFINIRQSGLTAAQLKERMLKHGLLVRDCGSFRGLYEYYVRVAVRMRRENEKLIEAFREVLS
jgi:histidinol-phosphate/aromatic aminotransferase/cobyric acid decarboxylase-like protein